MVEEIRLAKSSKERRMSLSVVSCLVFGWGLTSGDSELLAEDTEIHNLSKADWLPEPRYLSILFRTQGEVIG